MTSIKFCCYILKRNSDCHLKKKDSEVSKKTLLQASDEFLTSEIQYTLYTDSRAKDLWLFLCGCWATVYLHLYSGKSFLSLNVWNHGLHFLFTALQVHGFQKIGDPKNQTIILGNFNSLKIKQSDEPFICLSLNKEDKVWIFCGFLKKPEHLISIFIKKIPHFSIFDWEEKPTSMSGFWGPF